MDKNIIKELIIGNTLKDKELVLYIMGLPFELKIQLNAISNIKRFKT